MTETGGVESLAAKVPSPARGDGVSSAGQHIRYCIHRAVGQSKIGDARVNGGGREQLLAVPVAGGLGFTPNCTVTEVPWTIVVVGVSDKVVALGFSAEVTVLHLLTRLAAFTEPRPVVRS